MARFEVSDPVINGIRELTGAYSAYVVANGGPPPTTLELCDQAADIALAGGHDVDTAQAEAPTWQDVLNGYIAALPPPPPRTNGEWRYGASPDGERRFFCLAVGEHGGIGEKCVADDDGSGAPIDFVMNRTVYSAVIQGARHFTPDDTFGGIARLELSRFACGADPLIDEEGNPLETPEAWPDTPPERFFLTYWLN